MKLTAYTPQVQGNTIGATPRQTFNDGSADYLKAAAQQTAQAGQIAANIGRMQGQTLQGIANTINQVSENIDAVNVQAASNEYTKRLNDLLYNENDGLMNTKMQGADGITAKFEESERKIRQEVGGQFKFLTPKGAVTFNRMTDNSATQRFEMVRRHQTQQYNAYKNQVLNNALELNVQTAADNYTMPDVVEQNMREAMMSVAAHYYGQGEEVIKAAQKKAVGTIAQQVINRAYANGDIDKAESYIELYGRSMDPATLTGYAKNVYASRMATMQEVTAKTLFAQFGDNMEAAYNYINSAEFGGNGSVNNALAWYKDAEARGESLGKNQCTVGLNKALVAGGYKPINIWAPTAWEEIKDTSRAFKDRSKLRPGDIVYWNTSSIPGEASHVGMYAGDGKVCQSGDSGIRTIPLDTYTVVGFSRPEGKAATPEERKKLYNAYMQEVNLRKAFERQANQRVMDSIEERCFELSQNGETDPGAYLAVVAEEAGSNPKLMRQGQKFIKSYYGVSKKANTGTASDKATPGFKDKATQWLLNTGNVTKLLDLVDSDPTLNSADAANARNIVRQYTTNKGAFKYNWGPVKSKVMAGYPEKDKEFAWAGVQFMLIDKLNSYRAEHNSQDPPTSWLVAEGAQILATPVEIRTPGMLFDNKEQSKKWEYGNLNVTNIQPNPNGGWNVEIQEGYLKRTVTLTGEQLKQFRQGMSIDEVIGTR